MCGKFMPVLTNEEKYIANPTPPIDGMYKLPADSSQGTAQYVIIWLSTGLCYSRLQ